MFQKRSSTPTQKPAYTTIECPMFQNQIIDFFLKFTFPQSKQHVIVLKNINSFNINASKTKFLEMFLYIKKKIGPNIFVLKCKIKFKIGRKK